MYVRGSGDLVTVGKEELGMGDFLSPVLADSLAIDLEWKCLESK